jgi:hypothetical protein
MLLKEIITVCAQDRRSTHCGQNRVIDCLRKWQIFSLWHYSPYLGFVLLFIEVS